MARRPPQSASEWREFVEIKGTVGCDRPLRAELSGEDAVVDGPEGAVDEPVPRGVHEERSTLADARYSRTLVGDLA